MYIQLRLYISDFLNSTTLQNQDLLKKNFVCFYLKIYQFYSLFFSSPRTP